MHLCLLDVHSLEIWCRHWHVIDSIAVEIYDNIYAVCFTLSKLSEDKIIVFNFKHFASKKLELRRRDQLILANKTLTHCKTFKQLKKLFLNLMLFWRNAKNKNLKYKLVFCKEVINFWVGLPALRFKFYCLCHRC